MSKYTIEYRFNKHGKEPHCFDVMDNTGHCCKVFRNINAEEAKNQAIVWVSSMDPLYIVGRMSSEPHSGCPNTWDAQHPPETEIDRLSARVVALEAALRLARDCHGKMLLSDPPQEAWKHHRVDEVIRAALSQETPDDRTGSARTEMEGE